MLLRVSAYLRNLRNLRIKPCGAEAGPQGKG